MTNEVINFWHSVLEKACPSLKPDVRESLILRVIDHLFDHPWIDDEVRANICQHFADDNLDVEIPEEFKELL